MYFFLTLDYCGGEVLVPVWLFRMESSGTTKCSLLATKNLWYWEKEPVRCVWFGAAAGGVLPQVKMDVFHFWSHRLGFQSLLPPLIFSSSFSLTLVSFISSCFVIYTMLSQYKTKACLYVFLGNNLQHHKLEVYCSKDEMQNPILCMKMVYCISINATKSIV